MVEGYMDVNIVQARIVESRYIFTYRVYAAQAEIIKKFVSSNVIVAYDSDAADGQLHQRGMEMS